MRPLKWTYFYFGVLFDEVSKNSYIGNVIFETYETIYMTYSVREFFVEHFRSKLKQKIAFSKHLFRQHEFDKK